MQAEIYLTTFLFSVFQYQKFCNETSFVACEILQSSYFQSKADFSRNTVFQTS